MEDIGIGSLLIEVTNKCNLDCPHCYYYESGEKGEDYNDVISVEVIDKFFKNLNVKYINMVNFTGGEPLLKEDIIIEILHKFIRKKKPILSIDIATNGTILSEEIADELNWFSEQMYYIMAFNDDPGIRKAVEIYPTNNIFVNMRVSRLYHNTNPEKAYEFYKERMPNAKVEIIDDERLVKKAEKSFVSEEEKVTELAGLKLAYSGRAKKLNCDFYCDSMHHKIVYEDDNKMQVRCPLSLHYDGKISIAAICSRCHWDNDVIGSVFDGKSLREMITEWNYKTPLTCDEACELEQFRMAKELGNDWFDRRNGEENNLTDKKIEEGVRGKELRMFFLENYRLKLHEKAPCLTPEELEKISLYALDCEESEPDISEEEYEKIGNEIDNEIARMIWEHSFDDVKEIHEKYPWLTVEECKEFLDCCERMEEYKAPALVLLLDWKDFKRCCELEELNKYRKENVESEF